MRLVHTADWHIGKTINDYSLLLDQRDYFKRFIDELKIIKPDCVIIAGDLYDRSIPSAEATKLLNEIINGIVNVLSIKVFAIAGNHDSKERLSFGSELFSKSGFYIGSAIEKKITPVSFKCNGDNVNIYLLPYIEPHNIKPLFPEKTIKTHDEAMKLYTEEMISNIDKSAVNILIGHGLFGKGCANMDETSVGGSEMLDASIFKDFDYVALGHLHSYRTAGSERMVFSGSPLKYSIDEAYQEKGFCVLDIDKSGGFSLTRKTLTPLRDLRIINASFDELCEGKDGSDDYIFVNLTDTTVILNAISRLRSVFPNILGIKYVNLKNDVADDFIKDREGVENLSPHDLFSDFYKNITGEMLDESSNNYIASVFDLLSKNPQ